MKDTAKEISSERIRRLLAANNWSQSELAKMLDVSPQAVQQWVKGKSAPRGTSLTKLAKVTGLPEHWFFLTSDSDQLPAGVKSPEAHLDEQQKRLISLFKRLPETEKENVLAYIESRLLADYDALREELNNFKNL
ncbi:helix-turn-helix domain-containing protein [Rahnella aceris]|uniref:helix-turn-helix domain-containing protein n=1 Tax=Rahnella sp. (strain Y9602) TaxID=2703885 RepID=UPI001C274A6D|nr:helix-turn-helix domain-containing protein [Rahnella aceris]MBU9866784.1 helix-turn-helix domain-containing protein [Rahnella aceris]